MWRFILLFGTIFFICHAHAQPYRDLHGKISFTLMQTLNTASGDSITVSIGVRSVADQDSIGKIFKVERMSGSPIVVVRISKRDIDQLCRMQGVIFISEWHSPSEELSSGASDPTLNAISFAHARFPLIAGDSLHVSVKERLFDTSDIDLSGRVFYTGWEPSAITAHASLMATIIAGAANSSPTANGAAPASMITSASFLQLFPEPDSVFTKNKIVVQNHSYGTVIENFYGNEAASYDDQAHRLPVLLHVFSAGNSGNTTPSGGPYAGVAAYANLTGNFKQAKNVMDVGSIDSSGQLMPLSSKGPAYDGRIKPELMAYGEDGSSGAAALVSGAALLVQDAYMKLQHHMPSSSLVKSVLINSAVDLGAPHVDYQSGYGRLDAYKAIRTITDHRFDEQSITASAVNTIPLTIPFGVQQLKITLVWNDPARAPGASKALVNDLDLELLLPATGERWLPWVLDPSPDINALQQAALRKVDTLNNTEQVTLDFPAPGNYEMIVRGSHVTGTAQVFSIAWQMDTTNQFYFTFPATSDPLTAGNTHVIRWETNQAGTGVIEYATAANNWKVAATVPDVSHMNTRWQVPDTVATTFLRMKTAVGAYFYSDTFTITPQPVMQVGFQCVDSFLLFWQRLPVNAYWVYELSGKYLQSFLNTTDSSILLKITQHPSLFYAVAPMVNGKEGIRSVTINYMSQGVSCYLRSFFLQSQTPATATFTAALGSTFGLAEISFEKFSAAGWIVQQHISNPVSLVYYFSDTELKQGENRYRVKLKLYNGAFIYSEVETVYHLPAIPVVIYPNPVRQNSQLTIISNEAGRYTMQFMDAGGRVMFVQELNSNVVRFNSAILAKGIYLVRITDRNGRPFSQKLVVY